MKYNKELLLKPRTAIRCDNFEEFETIINLMKKEGVKNLPNYPKGVCDYFNASGYVTSHVPLEPFAGGFDDRERFESNNYKIL